MAAAAAESPHPLVKVTDIPGRGRSLVATRDIKPGEIILSDSPLLLYPATTTTTTTTSSSSFCSHCFRTLNPNPNPNTTTPRCSSCSSLFCSPRCLSLHPKPVCQTLTQLPQNQQNHDPESINQTNFLISAYSLSLSSPSDFQRLLSLQPSPTPTPTPTPHLPSPFPPDLTAALLARDLANAFGLQQQSTVRAYGIYPLASFFNHDCLPNACRFDYLDSPAVNNTDIVVRAIHDIPQGREVCLSYFPVNWPYQDRQKRLAEDYGFRCECDRCRVEMNWKDDDDAMEEEDGDDEGMEGEDDDGGDFPHAYFFVRYLCDRENCGGTLAPLPPSPEGVPSDMLECNVCGKLRKEEDDDGDGKMVDDE